MNQITTDDDEYSPYDPCPECGSQDEFYQETITSEVVEMAGDQPTDFIMEEPSTPLLVYCRNCDALLYDRVDEFLERYHS